MQELKVVAHDGLELSVTVAEAKETKALVQIIHGAKEHKGRYVDFIKYLNEQGFSVIISDNRGHGESVNPSYPLGYMDSYEQIVNDQLILTKYIKNLYPDKKLYLFGHSLGSVFARCYIAKHDDEIDKLVLSGTVNYVPGVGAGILLGKVVSAISGKHGYNQFLEDLSFKNQKDDLWISANKRNLERYRNDPFCQYRYQNSAVVTMLSAVKQLHNYRAFMCKNPSMPILSISGEDDPITGGTKGLKDTVRSLEKVGYHDITNIVYPGMKHEVLQEEDQASVYQDVVKFFDGK